MVYIPYPKTDLDNHASLTSWRAKAHKIEGDWTDLKGFLAEQPRFTTAHPIPKCWYTELPQGDNYALDVEHFRPKNQASPLTKAKLREVEKIIGFPILQNTNQGAYSWLEFDYRNYRLTTALPNRGGAKHIFFPLALNGQRLSMGQFPWSNTEFNLLLDPTNLHDSQQLVVLPDGQVIPSAARTELAITDFDNLATNWQTEGFNYLRAWITIIMYRLNDRILVEARRKCFESTTNTINELLEYHKANVPEHIKYFPINRIAESILPSAPFSLASRSALRAYLLPINEAVVLKEAIEQTLGMILQRVEKLENNTPISWNNP